MALRMKEMRPGKVIPGDELSILHGALETNAYLWVIDHSNSHHKNAIIGPLLDETGAQKMRVPEPVIAQMGTTSDVIYYGLFGSDGYFHSTHVAVET